MHPDMAQLSRRILDNMLILSPVFADITRVLPEEADALKRVGVIVGELNWEARRLP